MNPHQTAAVVGAGGPVVVNGEPSIINYLDALHAFALACEADRLSGRAAAVSFKHVSPAGAAVAGEVDETAAQTWHASDAGDDTLLSAYVRARDADPKSSYGDVVALSRPVDVQAADFLRMVFCDALIAPGFEPGTLDLLCGKRSGRFLILEADPDRALPERERRDVLGVTIEQDRDIADLTAALPTDPAPDEHRRRDALLGMATARYTQSNSVVLTRAGMAIGIGAGQQNRVDCVRLAGAKAHVWWLRRHPYVGDFRRSRRRGARHHAPADRASPVPPLKPTPHDPHRSPAAHLAKLQWAMRHATGQQKACP